jgi:3-hydroxyisobutyrate dehydrogenase-like beta-hydroxyacid dehydrogenase
MTDAVLSVCLGEHGAIGSFPPGAILAIVSTVAPDTIHRLTDIGPEDRVLESPVMGSSPSNRRHGEIPDRGSTPTVSSLDALWSDLGAGYTHCGRAGIRGNHEARFEHSPRTCLIRSEVIYVANHWVISACPFGTW